MSTFGGRLSEIPLISIDRFDGENLLSTCYFLSHCHTDHMSGIRDKAFLRRLEKHADIFLYCSAITWAILQYNGLREVIHKVKVLPIDACTMVEIPTSRHAPDIHKQLVLVTLLPAGHCPGSVMFLMEVADDTILYTGDIRLAVGDIEHLQMLHYPGGEVKKISTLYLDTTFVCSSSANGDTIPSRKESAREVCRLTKQWLDQADGNIVNLKTSSRYGSEFLFVELAKTFNTRIHVGPTLYNVYRHVPEILQAVTDDPRSRIHACYESIHRCGANKMRSQVRQIKPSVLGWYKLKTKIPGMSRNLGGEFYSVVYSCHSSVEELRHIVKHLNPVKIVPCVVPKGLTIEQVQAFCGEMLPKEPASTWEEETPPMYLESSPRVQVTRLLSPQDETTSKRIPSNGRSNMDFPRLSSPEISSMKRPNTTDFKPLSSPEINPMKRPNTTDFTSMPVTRIPNLIDFVPMSSSDEESIEEGTNTTDFIGVSSSSDEDSSS